ncbi:hypothetical protein CDV36_002205 [Fusarium kuroshium]|uniref:Major facilitator superfamily (MFS) profile domain-containing protein n=2 Tax=Fusarium solani species complex TaxID=232080 RepID=A0A3M2SKL0_9HYPO|nr:hypothetical protein CDV36_002205 [Fusarium kuroshium]
MDMLITGIQPSQFMASFMALWAVVSTLTAIAKDSKGLLPTRSSLGVVEAPFYPGHFNERVWHITASKCVAVLVFVFACTTLDIGAGYFAMCTFAMGVYSANNIIIGWVSAICDQNKEKKAISLVIVNTFESISAIYGPYPWPKWNAPRYTIPMLASAVFSIGAVLLAWPLRWMLVRANKKLIRQSGNIRPNLYHY